MNKATGFSLIELMIVVMIVGILMAISIPAYQGYVLRSHRTDAHSSLLDIAARQERHIAQYNRYADDITADDETGLNMAANSREGYYTLAAAACAGGVIANCYTITATAAGTQANDTDCPSISYNSVGTKTPAACW
jgi:type IV pilus assembly protein PilE